MSQIERRVLRLPSVPADKVVTAAIGISIRVGSFVVLSQSFEEKGLNVMKCMWAHEQDAFARKFLAEEIYQVL
jgi:hypothetical protein